MLKLSTKLVFVLEDGHLSVYQEELIADEAGPRLLEGVRCLAKGVEIKTGPPQIGHDPSLERIFAREEVRCAGAS